MIQTKNTYRDIWIIILLFTLLFLLLLGLKMGSISVSWQELADVFFGDEWGTKYDIVFGHRLPKVLAALLTGIALPIGGLLMQEFFRNPLAGPSVLGISSTSGLGVALAMMGVSGLGLGNFEHSPWFLILFSFIGAMIGLFTIGVFALKNQSTSVLIILGFLLAGFSSSLISLLQYFSDAQDLQRFVFWGFGSFTGLDKLQLGVFFLTIVLGGGLGFFALKGLTALQLGENYALTLGVPMNRLKILIFISTSLLVAACTAFVGPIAFVGLAIPHISRMLFGGFDKFRLYFYTLLLGANFLVLLLLISENLFSTALPINILTALLGTPFMVFIIFYKKVNSL